MSVAPSIPIRVKCIHLNNGTCRIASALAGGIPIATYETACIACKQTPRPMALNSATCTLAYAVTKDPQIKAAFDRFNTIRHNRPGTCLRSIFQELGISEQVDCSCDEYAALMDLWGTEGCIERIDEIVTHLNSQSYSWYDMAKVALGGYLTTKSLVQEAIQCSLDCV